MNRLVLTAALVAASALSHCHARPMPLASTVAAGRRPAGGSKKKGRSLKMPKLWGRQSERKKPESIDGDDGNGVDEASDPKSQEAGDSSDGSDAGESNNKMTEEGATEEQSKPSPADANTAVDKSQSDEKEVTSDDGKDADKEPTEQHEHSEVQPANQTRPGILYLSQPASPMMPHARPMMPYPYMPQQTQPQRNKSPSLLSSILSLFLPRPHNLPPSPYGPPPMPPSSPGGSSPILSLILRLALISVGTLIIDFFGLGSHSEAFLPTPAQHYTFERVNDRYRRDGSALKQALESPPPGVPRRKWKRAFGRRRKEAVGSLILAETESATAVGPPSLENGGLYNRTVIIVEMKPDGRVGNGMAEHLRDTVSFLIEQHRDHVDTRLHANPVGSTFLSSKLLPRYFSSGSSGIGHRSPQGMRTALGTELEVVLFLDSPGGTVQDYGLASSHLSRLRKEPRVTLSVCVDRVAASGGYMMACQATPGHLFAAPFAMVGSIGVIMETVNVNEILKRYGVRPLVIKAGKNKAPLSGLGEVTEDEMKLAQDDADVIHGAFQKWVTESRPGVVADRDWVEKVCTGSVFLGNDALELGLVDRVVTSDEYISERIAAGDRVLRLIPYKGPQFGLKLSPLDLLLSGMDAEGRAKICQRVRGWGRDATRNVASLFRVGAAVGILNQLASFQSQRPGYSWPA